MSDNKRTNTFSTLAGFNIIQVSKKEWYFQIIDEVAYVGTFRQVVIFAVKHYGFDIHQIDRATQDMISLSHNAAHFGHFGSFMYSFNQNLMPVRMAS